MSVFQSALLKHCLYTCVLKTVFSWLKVKIMLCKQIGTETLQNKHRFCFALKKKLIRIFAAVWSLMYKNQYEVRKV